MVTSGGGPFGLPCTVVTEPRSHVTELRLSDREFYLFRPRLTKLAAVVGGCVGTVAYEFVDGTLSGATLEVLGNRDVLYTSGETVTEFDGGADTGLVFDPRRVRLTTPDGRVVDFERGAGITRLADAHGRSLTITAAGIVHSSGKSVAFARDAAGRIVRITDPKGGVLSYDYDATGRSTIRSATGHCARTTTRTEGSSR
jgi:YD repeat-containing protein